MSEIYWMAYSRQKKNQHVITAKQHKINKPYIPSCVNHIRPRENCLLPSWTCEAHRETRAWTYININQKNKQTKNKKNKKTKNKKQKTKKNQPPRTKKRKRAIKIKHRKIQPKNNNKQQIMVENKQQYEAKKNWQNTWEATLNTEIYAQIVIGEPHRTARRERKINHTKHNTESHEGKKYRRKKKTTKYL